MYFTVLLLLLQTCLCFSRPALEAQDDYDTRTLQLKELVNDLKRARQIGKDSEDEQSQFSLGDFKFHAPARKRDDLENLKVMEWYNRAESPDFLERNNVQTNPFAVSTKKRNFIRENEDEIRGAADHINMNKIREFDTQEEVSSPRKGKYDFDREVLAIMSSPREYEVNERRQTSEGASFAKSANNNFETRKEGIQEQETTNRFSRLSGKNFALNSQGNDEDSYQSPRSENLGLQSTDKQVRERETNHHRFLANFGEEGDDFEAREDYRRSLPERALSANANDANVLQALNDLLPQQARNGPRDELRVQRKDFQEKRDYLKSQERRNAVAIDGAAESNQSPSQAFDKYFQEEVKRSDQNGVEERALFGEEASQFAIRSSDGKLLHRGV